MHQQLLLSPEFEPPRAVDRRAEVVAKVQQSQQFRPGFSEWLQDNWSIWLRFEFEASKMRERGWAHYGARMIGEYIRHHTNKRQKKPVFKINDHIWPDVARLYIAVHPEAKGFFELRGRR